MREKPVNIFQYNFKRLLALKGWDLADCAAHSGISLGVLKKYSAGYREPVPEFRKILEDTFEVETVEFYRPISGEIPPPTQKLGELTQGDLRKVLREVLTEKPKDHLTKQQKELLTIAEKIPAETLKLLSEAGDTYINSLQKELEMLISKRSEKRKTNNR
ncbi:hypothetical protein ACES2L_06120 [Bdellovibrio bacteriovorus]